MNIQTVKDFASGFKRGLLPTQLDRLMEKWRGPDHSTWGKVQGWIVAAALTGITLLLAAFLVAAVGAWIEG